ncbi:MAG: signal peptidase II [Butyrivibrio sp.]|nr:signal peptidase II [Acetatifactor muris]MCM1560284.1 signal peptidase II [Butyrivibrio sp.]
MLAAIGFVTLVSVIFFGDLYIKNRVEKYIPARGSEKDGKELLGGRLILRRHHNRGMALNVGEKRQRLVAAVSLALTAVVAAVFIISLGHRGNHLLRIGLALLLGGAFSNTYDRLKRKYVVDYFSFGVKWKGLRKIVFNLSDFCIMIGALLAALGAA